jgi:hypothetical protein
MKRGTPRHPKVAQLRELLKIVPAAAIGYLELLWHFTAEFAPQGDIGKYDDARIEAALMWTGKRGRLVEALRQAGWVDPHPEHRLVVHHWHDHADNAVQKRLQRAGLPFLTFTAKVTDQRRTTADNGSLPEPEPSPEPSHALPGPEPRPERVRELPRNGRGAHARSGVPASLSSRKSDDDDFRTWASPTDELKARFAEITGEPITFDVLDAIRSNLGGDITEDFVRELRGHKGNFFNFPGFVRDFSGKFRQKTAKAAPAEEKPYTCSACGSKVPGEGLRLVAGEFQACQCASADYIARQRANGTLKSGMILVEKSMGA